jgi:hypothetical protein
LTRLLRGFVSCGRINKWLGLAKTKESEFRKRGLTHATNIIGEILKIIGGAPAFIEDIRASFAEIDLLNAIQRHDTGALFNWLIAAIHYQGVSDAVADSYIAKHGCVTFKDIKRAIDRQPSCPKLQSYWNCHGCGYRKSKQSCNEPQHMPDCPLPKHDLRNGSLNQAAYSLYLFMRDVAGNDFVTWLDRRLERADMPRSPDRGRLLCEAVLEPLRHVHGLSDKVLSMSMASVMLAGDPNRERWIAAGAHFVAIDTLVHNFMHRSGILSRLGVEHDYGPACYRSNGCAAIIERVSTQIDTRKFNPDFPRCFPRFVQVAIWQFCAWGEYDRCNGNNIDDRSRCEDDTCPLFTTCDRVALRPDPDSGN